MLIYLTATKLKLDMKLGAGHEQIFQEPITAKDPFDTAQDNFMLAGIIIVHNPLFASFALHHADNALQLIKQGKNCNQEMLRIIANMEQQIQSLQSGIKDVNVQLMGTKN